MNNFITRQKHGKKFRYFDGDQPVTNPVEIERINKLVIPPAWYGVAIAKSARAKVQATGYDAAERKQAIYHPRFRKKQEAAKFERLVTFAEALPVLRQHIEKDLRRHGLPKEKVLACVLKLIDHSYFRIGNDVYAKEHQTYGITTFRSRHTDVHGTHVTFDFCGKSGMKHRKTITDRQIARVVRQLDELPGYEIFKYLDDCDQLHPISSRDVNCYIKAHMGDEYTAKDFRTWGGTMKLTTLLGHSPRPDTEKERKKAVTSAVKQVAHLLGNTPAVARSSYINPKVISAYHSSTLLGDIAKKTAQRQPRHYCSPDETYTLQVLHSLS